MSRTTSTISCAAALLIALACEDATGPDSPRVIVSGPATVDYFYSIDPSATDPETPYAVTCEIPLTAELVGKTSSSATWTGATITYTRAFTNAPWAADTMSAQDVFDFWGQNSVFAGTPRNTNWRFWAGEPFRASLEFRYRNTGGTKEFSASYSFHCEPPAPPIKPARYVLSMINNVPVPAYSVIGDTVEFFPNITYTASGTYMTSSAFDPLHNVGGKTAARGYIIHADGGADVLFPLWDLDGGVAKLTGTILTLSIPQANNHAAATWRFDKQGSNPTLPVSPRLLASPSQVTFSVTQNGPLADSQVVQLTSSTANQAYQVVGFTTGTLYQRYGGPNFINQAVSFRVNANTTPTSIVFWMTSSSVAVAQYDATLSLNAGTGIPDLIIPVVLKVLAP